MAEIRPFCGIRYAGEALSRDVSSVLAPPYDVLGEADKAALLAGSDRNIVAVDLPHVPPKEAGPDAVYAEAAEQLAGWLNDGTLARDEKPALYRYHQTFPWAGRQITRKMLLARVRLERFGEGSVFPHEQTFPGPKADRLKLMQTTACQLSPIFSMYTDPQGQVQQALGTPPGPADASGTLDDLGNELWVVDDAQAQAQVVAAFASKNVYIADGHHRYETALTYRDWVVQTRGGIAPDHPANFVMMVLCAMEDDGLLVLPTHRVVRVPGGFDEAGFLQAIRERYTADAVTDAGGAAAVADSLASHGPGTIGLYVAASRSYHVLRPRRDDVLADLAPERGLAWRQLAVAGLHRYLIQEVLEPRQGRGEPLAIRYVKDAAGAVDAAAGAEGGVAFLLPPIDLTAMRALCEAGDVTPQKATYFFPKLATGLVINPLED